MKKKRYFVGVTLQQKLFRSFKYLSYLMKQKIGCSNFILDYLKLPYPFELLNLKNQKMSGLYLNCSKRFAILTNFKYYFADFGKESTKNKLEILFF